ncbi:MULTISPECIES: DUF5076 domain-containing protein [unclassified Sphingomonas]|jgi:Domain of unknown function (DUF5076)|uniref:DUF5076 domain-containing protein n=1 Tax=unclassified Sphingomonas TaxID=196159 RepID=UPI0013005A3E|nr:MULTISPECIES: DUF5076 domain-containing protein [unclassified Sphingomonas]
MSGTHKGEIALENGAPLTDASAEVARIWVTDGAGSSVWIDASVLQDPMVFGYLMADTIRHAARAYAGTWTLDEGEALQRIVDGLTQELREQRVTITTIQEGSLN